MAERSSRGQEIFGCLVLLAFGAVSLYLGLPDDGPVKCDGQVMQPGDFCGPIAGRIITANGRPPASNYDAIAAHQHAATPFAIVLGVIFLIIGVASLAVLLWPQRKTAR